MKGGDGVFSNSQEFVSQQYERQRSEEIPQDLVIQILPLLPVKSLRRFKCVCKSWRNLISDSQFQKMYLNQSIKANRLKYLLCEFDRCFRLDYETLIFGKEIEMEEITYASLFRSVIKDDSRKFCSTEVLGSCNGLLCILTYHRMALTYESTLLLANPSTRETKAIFTHYPLLKDYPYPSFKVGFGYDAVNDDYKVLKIYPCNFSIDVYSLRKNKWDHKGSFPKYRHAIINECSGKCVNGTIHWLAHTEYTPHIVAFDLTKEEFVNILLPPPPPPASAYLNDLGSDGKYLYASHFFYNDIYEIWKMETYGVGESWKCISLVLDEPERRFSNICCLNILNFPISEIDLYYVCGSLVLQNGRNKKIRWVRLNQVVQGNTIPPTAFSYVESLISLGSDGN